MSRKPTGQVFLEGLTEQELDRRLHVREIEIEAIEFELKQQRQSRLQLVAALALKRGKDVIS